jgi:ATP-dependent Lhr-like helicase
VRRAAPYRTLSPQAFETVLEMVSALPLPARPRGKDVTRSAGTMTALQPRVSWDRVHNRLHAASGSQQMALVGGGTIPDTGQYAVYTANGARIGELDEEFIYERRVGDTFLLGTTPGG